jgi:hypothetical protein
MARVLSFVFLFFFLFPVVCELELPFALCTFSHVAGGLFMRLRPRPPWLDRLFPFVLFLPGLVNVPCRSWNFLLSFVVRWGFVGD